ncbi:MAG: hypothetical protein TREMPRED_004040 [Tremellales sp. Tagirdzhanova-0007]|nr:MAG: hypothetical protein TREMPRED_004040 [Tremellales sp. Tagirdzhanova-0007]
MLVLPNGPMWKHHRRIMGPAMTNRFLGKSAGQINQSIVELVSLWESKTNLAMGKAFDANADMENASMDAICGLAFGTSWGCNRYAREQIETSKAMTTGELDDAVFKVDRPDLANAVYHVLQSLGYPNRPFPTLAHWFIRLTPAYRTHKSRLDNEFRRAINESRRLARKLGQEGLSPQDAENTLDLMTGRGGSGKDELPENEMADELFTYLLAGTETTSSALSWWLKFMTNNPKMQIKLREHVQQQAYGKRFGELGLDDLTPEKTPYLEAIIHETLRHGRVSVAYGRVAYLGLEESSNWKTGQGEDATRKVGYWQPGSARLFDPERWLEEDGSFAANRGPSLPFGNGVRRCFGKNLALLEMRLFFAQLNMTYFFAPVGDVQNSFEAVETVTRHPKKTLIRIIGWDSPEAQAALARA